VRGLKILVTFTLVVAVYLPLRAPEQVLAGRGSAPTTTVVVDDDSDTVTVGIGVPGVTVPGEPGGVPVTTMPDDCTEGWYTIGGRVSTWVHPVTGNIMANWATECPGVLDLEPRVYRAPTPADLIPGVYGAVLVQITPPMSSISPPARAPVGLGLWLAVDEPHQIVESRRVGPFTVTVRAVVAGTSYEMADGVVIACPGGGVPIGDLDTVHQGPCGHVHDRVIDAGTVTITATWAISYETTIGDGVLPSITTTAVSPYCTYEIQTVGGSSVGEPSTSDPCAAGG
jgi:hypothetical protein